VVTSGGKLPLRYIIHAVTVDWANGIMPTERTMQQLVREILSRCEALRIKRIAIPALATGSAGLSPLISAEIIVGGLQEHCLNPTVLETVVLTIPDPAVRLAFVRNLKRVDYPATTAAPDLREKSRQDWTAGDLTVARMSEAPATEAEPEAEARGSRSAELMRRLLRLGRQSRTETGPSPIEPTPNAREHKPLLSVEDTGFRPILEDRFVLLEEVGRGGMGVVYLAWDLVLRRTVAIKVLRPEATEPDSLKREAAVALDLSHQSIMRLYHFEPGKRGGAPFLVMEYLRWPSGEKWIAEAGAARLPVPSVASVGVRICDALVYAHERRVLHLDIKPSNIFVEPGGEDAKLGDFGLAQVAGASGKLLQLRQSGTPAYMAPEQRVTGAKLGPATDVYQLSATLWDFLTGAPPNSETSNLDRLEPERSGLLSVLADILCAEPAGRPSASRLREIVASAG
jgi:hypothetical protein